jgi:hypothetical protein
MTTAPGALPLLFMDNRRAYRTYSPGRKDMRRTFLDYAAFFSRHSEAPRRAVSLAATAWNAPACGTAGRPPRSAPARERCGNSGLRSLGDHRRPGELPARPGDRRQGGEAPHLRNAPTPRWGETMATGGEIRWPPAGRNDGHEWGIKWPPAGRNRWPLTPKKANRSSFNSN